MTRFVLLDRDGVINRRIPGGYVLSWSQFVFLPQALDALSLLTQLGCNIIVVSNQACVGKGLISKSGLAEITQRFVETVEKHGGRVQGVYYCIHRKEAGCECRKPKPGLLLEAQQEHGFSFTDTLLIGDTDSDMQAADAVGCPAWLISNVDPDQPSDPARGPRAVFPSLYAAAQFLC